MMSAIIVISKKALKSMKIHDRYETWCKYLSSTSTKPFDNNNDIFLPSHTLYVYDMVIIELEVLDEIAEHYSRILKKVSNT